MANWWCDVVAVCCKHDVQLTWCSFYTKSLHQLKEYNAMKYTELSRQSLSEQDRLQEIVRLLLAIKCTSQRWRMTTSHTAPRGSLDWRLQSCCGSPRCHCSPSGRVDPVPAWWDSVLQTRLLLSAACKLQQTFSLILMHRLTAAVQSPTKLFNMYIITQ